MDKTTYQQFYAKQENLNVQLLTATYKNEDVEPIGCTLPAPGGHAFALLVIPMTFETPADAKFYLRRYGYNIQQSLLDAHKELDDLDQKRERGS
jgi:hypothetical protein